MSYNQKPTSQKILEAIGGLFLVLLRTMMSAVGFLLACGTVGAGLGAVVGLIYGFPVLGAAIIGAVLGVVLAIALRVLPFWDL